MLARDALRKLAYSTLSAAPITEAFFRLGDSRLRVLGFHGISSERGFRRQMEWLADHCNAVSASQVVHALAGTSLPPRPVWVTFDDGDPSVVEVGLPILRDLHIHATMFVCPGLVDTDLPFWWQTVEKAIELGVVFRSHVITDAAVGEAKRLPDEERRQMVNELNVLIASATGTVLTRPQVTTGSLQRWVDAGHSLGNHTWDHPILSRCTVDQQARQIVHAHEWLIETFKGDAALFAYPNGESSTHSEEVLRSLNYDAAVLFDHRLSGLADPYHVSRLRVNADGEVAGFRARVSGTHAAVYHARLRLLGR